MDNTDLLDAYNKLTQLLGNPTPTSTPKQKLVSSDLENKIDILNQLIELDSNKEIPNQKPNNSLFEIDKSQKENIITNNSDPKSLSSKNILPHMEDLFQILLNNDILKTPEKKDYTFMEDTPQERTKKKIIKEYKKDKYQSFAIYKKKKPEDCLKTVNRFNELDKQRKEKLEFMRKELEEEELREIKVKPDINIETGTLLGQNFKPIYLRTEEVLSNRESRNKQLRNQLQKIKDEIDPPPKYRPDLSLTKENSLNLSKQFRSKEKFIEEIGAWDKKRTDKITNKQINYLSEELKNLTFHPKINTRLINKIMRKGEKIEDRLLKCEEQYKSNGEKMREKSMPSFNPKINKKTINVLHKKDPKRGSTIWNNTICCNSKSREKYQEKIDEKDLKFSEQNRTHKKKGSFINEISYDKSKKFLLDVVQKHKKKKLFN